MHLHYEHFYTTPNTVETKACRVCGATCDVKRGVYTRSNFQEAVNKMADLYDVFTCPNAGKGWHEQAFRLVQAIEATPSKRVAELMQLDLQDLLRENGVV
jgi:hypothetical protein